jgi:O-antigen/teichoic acid export membrane protein
MIWQNRILRAYGTSLLGVFSGLITNLWLLREITRHVSVTDFGIYAFVLQVSAYLNILQLGLDFAASRQIAESLGKKDPAAANRAYWELKRVNRLSVGFVLVAVIALSLAFQSGLLLPNAGQGHLATGVAALAGTALTIAFLSRPYSAALIGTQYLSTVNVLTASRTVVTSLLAYLILVRGYGILSVPIAEVVMQFLAWIVLGHLYRRHCSWRTTTPSAGDKSLRRSLLKFGTIATLGGFAWTVEGTSDVLILGWLAGPVLVATYVLWWRFPQMLFDLCTRLAFSAFPGFAQRHGESAEASRVLFQKVSTLTVGLATMALLGISLWLPPFIHNWVGGKFAVADPHLLAFGMGLLICLRTCGNLLGLFWMTTGRATLTTVSNWAQAAVKVGLALVLARKYGLVGLVGASCVAAAFQIIFVGVFILKERFVDTSQALRSVAFTAVAIIMALVAWRIPADTRIVYLTIGALVTVLGWMPIWLIFAWKTELQPSLISVIGGISYRLGLPRLVPRR